MRKNMIGAYGAWAAGLVGSGPGPLSFRNPRYRSVAAWHPQAQRKVLELMAVPGMTWRPRARVRRRFSYEGLEMEELSWQLPYGPPTRALFLKPAGRRGRLPAILALHDHGGKKYFGVEKITRTPARPHPIVREHQRDDYGGIPWANAAARRGYAVLVHDGFLFGSRRVRYADVSDVLMEDLREPRPGRTDEVEAYNRWAAGHEHIMAKSLFCAGTTWPGVFFFEDRCALDYLCSRPDVDASRVGCGGLSGGGLRTVFLAGLDPRIRAAVCVGFMSTWRDFLLNKCWTHTWMTYVPLLPAYLDFPEILGLRVPKATLVLNDTEDPLYTLAGMKAADRLLRELFRKAGAPDRYRCSYYPGPHKFDAAMQAEAFEWFDRHLDRKA